MGVSVFGGAVVAGSGGHAINLSAAGVLVATEATYSVTNGGNGTKTQLVASTPADYLLAGFEMICPAANSNSAPVEFSVWAGVAASEVLVASLWMGVKSGTTWGPVRLARELAIPVAIPAGTRLAASVTGGLGDTTSGWLMYVRLTPVRS